MKNRKPQPLNLEDLGQEWIVFRSKELVKEMKRRFNDLEIFKKIKHRIKSACEFYLKFRHDPSVFFAFYPQYYDDFEKECGLLSENLEDTTCFNEWLFHLAFKDVLGGENDKKNSS